MSMEVTVGAFMFMVLLALGVFTIILSRENIFKKSYPVKVHFADVMGLRVGDNVFVRGVDVGKIKDLDIGHDGVYLTANLEQPIKIYADYKVEILPASVLGGRYLSIDGGTPDGKLVDSTTVLHGQPPLDLINEASDTISMIRKTLNDGVLSDLKVTMHNVRMLSDKLSSGEGTIGKLLADDAVYDDLRVASAGLKTVSEQLANGEGTIGKLLASDDVYNDLSDVAGNLKQISDRLAAGQGTLGKLLSQDDVLYEDIAAAAAAVRKIAVSLEDGDGTLGKLMTDDTLYDETKDLLSAARGAIDDFREAAPITTFSSIFFGAF